VIKIRNQEAADRFPWRSIRFEPKPVRPICGAMVPAEEVLILQLNFGVF
jgi:hypothetical protein